MSYEDIETLLEDGLFFKQNDAAWAWRFCVLDLLGPRIIVFMDRTFANQVRDIKFSKYDLLQYEEDRDGKEFVWSVGRTGGKLFYFSPDENLARASRRKVRLDWMRLMKKCVEQGEKSQQISHEPRSMPAGANHFPTDQSEKRRLIPQRVEMVNSLNRANSYPTVNETPQQALAPVEQPQIPQPPQTGIAREGMVQFKFRGNWEPRFLRLYIDQKSSSLLIYPTQNMVKRPETITLANCNDYVTESGNLVFGVISQHSWGRNQHYDFVPSSAVEKEAWKEDILLAIQCAKTGLDFFAEIRRRDGNWCFDLTAKCMDACSIL